MKEPNPHSLDNPIHVRRVADHIHETSRTCKNEAEQRDGLWDCEDCLHTAKQALWFLSNEFFSKCLTYKEPK